MADIGPLELVIVLVIVLLVFGPKRLPSLGRQLGSGIREFKDGITGRGSRDEEPEQLTAAPASPEGERDGAAAGAVGAGAARDKD